uniref:Protein kinase domain-containing protein n=1 Tax=Acrobeloides nanus TaxID=290746 RepID=A0A914D0E8_9BILA
MGNRNYYWRVYFKLLEAEIVTNEVALSKNVSISANQVTNYSKLTISGSDKTPEIYYQGAEPKYPTSGVLYAYNASSSLINLIGIFPYPSSNTTIISSHVNQVTLFYVGVSTNTIMIVSRIAEYHAANCDQDQNLIFLSREKVYYKEIRALNSGTCIFSLIIPISDLDGYYNAMGSSPEYNGASSVSLVAGYNASYTLLEFNNKTTGTFKSAIIFGTIVSFLIPPNGRLMSFCSSGVMQVGFVQYHFSTDHFFAIFMSPNYPSWSHASTNKSDLIEYNVEYASITLKIFAFIPEQSYFTIYDSNTTFVNITHENYTNTITFNSTQFQIDLVSYNSTVQWQGYLVQAWGSRINPPNNTIVHYVHEKGGLREGLIIGLSCLGLVVILVVIALVTRHQLKKRYHKFDQLCNALKGMNLSPEEIIALKEKSDQLLISPSKLHINFDHIFGQGSTSTVYKAYLMGSAPLHLLQRSIVTQRFADCDVAAKITNRFGKSEVEQLFKEIEAMKAIGYHENVMCILGWALSEETPCLVYDIAEKDVLNYVMEFKDASDDQVPYKKFLSILWQTARGMQYVTSKGLIHRDLTARNIFLFGSIVAKISDFSLCCYCDEGCTYQETANIRFPLKWTSLESLVSKIFSEKSDVWSFGVLTYEMFSFGRLPYAGLSDDELVGFLENGHRLERLVNVDNSLHDIMTDCWMSNPEDRPKFTYLEEKFHAFIEIRSELYGYVEAGD